MRTDARRGEEAGLRAHDARSVRDGRTADGQYTRAIRNRFAQKTLATKKRVHDTRSCTRGFFLQDPNRSETCGPVHIAN